MEFEIDEDAEGDEDEEDELLGDVGEPDASDDPKAYREKRATKKKRKNKKKNKNTTTTTTTTTTTVLAKGKENSARKINFASTQLLREVVEMRAEVGV